MMRFAGRSLPEEEIFRDSEPSFDVLAEEQLERDICSMNIPDELPAVSTTADTIRPARKDTRRAESCGLFHREIEHLSELLDRSSVASFMIDRHCEVVIWNHACEMLTLIPKEYALGTSLNGSHPFDNEALPLPMLAGLLLETNGARVSEYTREGILRYDPRLEVILCKGLFVISGERRVLRINASRMRDGTGRLVGALQYAQDDDNDEEAPTFYWINDS